MFKAAWATISAFAFEQGLRAGMTAILHTWGSNLFYHPHLHCIVPGGGMDESGAWHHLKGCKKSHFLFPVAAMSRKFRGRFMRLLTTRLKQEGMVIGNEVRHNCFKKDRVVYSCPPAKGINQVLEYIARYAYRVDITNFSLSTYTPRPVRENTTLWHPVTGVQGDTALHTAAAGCATCAQREKEAGIP